MMMRTKTSTSLHVGAALAKFHKKKVLLIDLDAQANLTTGLGYDPDANGRPCGHCDSCQLRNRGFAELGMTDPALR